MKAVNFLKKREGFFAFIASLSFVLVLFPQLSFSQQGSSSPAPERPITESGSSAQSKVPITQAQAQEEKDATPPSPTEVEKPAQAVPEIPPVQEQVPSQTPPDISPPAIEPEKPIIKEEQVVPDQPPVQEQAQPLPPPEAPPLTKEPGKTVTYGKDEVPEGPPIMLTLNQAIKTALTGNRPFLDRIDLIKQRQGLGQAAGSEQLIQLPGGANLSIPVTTASGVASAETQFQTQVNPSFSVTRGQVAGSTEATQIESYGLGISKFFITGGQLNLTPSVTSSKFETFTSGLQANFTQPLLRGAWPFVVGEPVTSAKSDLFKEELNAGCCEDTSRQGLIFNVISQYYGIKNQRELVEIAKKAVERSERLFKATQAKQNVELATQLDVSRAEVQLSTQQVAFNQAVQDLGNKQETFKVLLGLNTRETIELTDEVVYQPSEGEIKAEDLPKFIEIAIKNRPDLKSQQVRVDDADRRLRIARNSLLPGLASSFNYTVDNVGGLNDTPFSVAANSRSWSGTLTLSYPLPLTSTNINIEQNAVQLRREERTLVEKRENISRDINTDLRNVVKLQEQIPIVKSQIESAEKKLKIANFRFDRGLASNFDIVDAENNLIQARQNLTKSIVDYLIAKNQLKRDMGVLTDEK